MTKAKANKPIRPRAWKETGFYTPKVCLGVESVWFDVSSLDSKDCRRLSSWLLSAASYLDSRKQTKKAGK